MESHRVRVENLDLSECKDLMRDFIRQNPALWNEDIGTSPAPRKPVKATITQFRPSSTEQDRRFMRRAIELSAVSSLVEKAGGPFGAVIVDKDGNIVAEGTNRVIAENDPTWHAEMEAIREASKKTGRFKLSGCTLYSSAECCPMCAAAAYWSGIDRIFYAATCSDALKYGDFDDQMIYNELSKRSTERSIPATQMLRNEALEIWKKYQTLPGRVQY
jgi:tRNA(Arg) A34 adenosine deaminase TadA